MQTVTVREIATDNRYIFQLPILKAETVVRTFTNQLLTKLTPFLTI